jgi:hypothetical protein
MCGPKHGAAGGGGVVAVLVLPVNMRCVLLLPWLVVGSPHLYAPAAPCLHVCLCFGPLQTAWTLTVGPTFLLVVLGTCLQQMHQSTGWQWA